MRLGSAKPNEATRAQRRLAIAADAELRVGEWADGSAAAMRALGLGRAATLLDVPAEACTASSWPALSGRAFRRSRTASMPGSGWDSTGGVPRACGRDVRGAVPVE